MSAFADLVDLVPLQIWDGVLGRVVHGDEASFATIEIAPDTHIPSHQHHNEQIGILVSGTLTFRAGDETRDLEPGGTWRVPGGVSHEVWAGPGGAVAVEVFVPHRADWAGLERMPASALRWPPA